MTAPATAPSLFAYRTRSSTAATRATAVVCLVLFAVLATLPAWGPSGTMRLLVQFLTILAMAQMWNLLAGFAGLVSIGQQAFVGIGAYGLFVAMDLQGLPPLAAIVAVGVFAIFVASATSLFAFRLRGGYFAIGTWVIAEVFRLVVSQMSALGSGQG